METRLRERFAAQMSRGDLILFTGAGFSLSATSRSGQHIPSVKDLRELLWPIAFPGIQIDNESSLGEVFQCALNTAGGRVRQTMQTALDVDPLLSTRMLSHLVFYALEASLYVECR